MRFAVVLLLGWTLASPAAGQVNEPSRWPRFRGPNGSGVSTTDDPPVVFGPTDKLLWKAPVPPGHSSPIVWDDHLFLTALDGDALVVIAFARTDGAVRWRRSVTPEALEEVQEFNSPAASTPVTDGGRVYAYFGSFGLVAYDFDGDELWRRRLPTPKTQYGTASSPILVGGKLVLQRDSQDGQSELLALDTATGDVAWRAARPALGESYSTPVLWSHGDADEIVTLGFNRIVAYAPESGEERWWVPGSTPQPIGVPVVGGGLLFASATYAGSVAEPLEFPSWEEFASRYDVDQDSRVTRAEIPVGDRWVLRPELPEDTPGASTRMRALIWFSDKDEDGAATSEEWDGLGAFFDANRDRLVAVRPGAGGAALSVRIAWSADRGLSEMPSPLYYRDRLYFVRDGGMVTSYEATTGEAILDRRRLGALGRYVASPVAAAGRIYVASQRGTVVVFRAGDTLEVLARNDLGEDIHATPAIADDNLYIRTAEHLWAFGE